MGEYNFMSKKNNALDIVESVHSWMKNNPHLDAKKQTKWCEQLIDMLKNKEVTYNTSSVARNSTTRTFLGNGAVVTDRSTAERRASFRMC